MLGGASYGQTQYAHTGLREASKLEFFQEFVTLADSKFLAMKKAFIDSVLVYDLIERLILIQGRTQYQLILAMFLLQTVQETY